MIHGFLDASFAFEPLQYKMPLARPQSISKMVLLRFINQGLCLKIRLSAEMMKFCCYSTHPLSAAIAISEELSRFWCAAPLRVFSFQLHRELCCFQHLPFKNIQLVSTNIARLYDLSHCFKNNKSLSWLRG